MKGIIHIATVLGLLIGCAPDPRSRAERLAAAARADSSAAGYDVGVSPTPSGGRNGEDDAGHARLIRTASSGAPAGPSAVTSTPSQVAGGPGGDTSQARGVAAPGHRPSSESISVRSPTRIDSLSGARSPMPIREADFLAYDSVRKTLAFQLSAGSDSSGLVNFNGSVRGARVLTVPLGWRVTISFVNRDSLLPHSAIVVGIEGGIPEELPAPAFARALSARVRDGLLNGSTEELEFVAERAGEYLLACGVFAHTQRGQWITLRVSRTAAVPSYR